MAQSHRASSSVHPLRGRPELHLSPFGQRGVAVVKDGGGAPVETRRVTIGTAAGLWQFETAAGETYTLLAVALPSEDGGVVAMSF